LIHLRLPTEHSFLWVCPQCSTTWAVLDSSFGGKAHFFLHAECESCGLGALTCDFWMDQNPLDDTLSNILAVLPYDMLVREVLLYTEELTNEFASVPFNTFVNTAADHFDRFVDSQGREGPP
jgi:hypothetical protein